MSRDPSEESRNEVVSVESPVTPAAVVLLAAQQQQPLPSSTGPWAVSLGGCSFTIDEGNIRRLEQAALDGVALTQFQNARE